MGTIAVDALFSPVQKVKYNVTNARVGQNTDFDKLALEIYTDGSVDPEDALAFAAKILKEQMQVFINFQEQDEPIVEEVVEEEEQWNEHLYLEWKIWNSQFVLQTACKMLVLSTSISWFSAVNKRC